ncbi:methyl-accepting chemotaxis sensory transducer with Pas/Pac sensor [Pseudodesulfovibrio mercurii]|uniref:Methyl-accepting chemotaxis sensory transducer with Pas/Pac sensor n=1 Tax=Pseudodesulfovibrio mercurii TaxID=641491 RepID=F0JIG1_9BACT|nr:methyl-accepting chemotaxis protein [Pseudodesulfovibrio mercurii]EGB14213.1 methyl-accepting chemotaxis sensory transducer with Pas/Pac sensor [Pseudodesulfovibrio mercurii]
MSNKTPFCFKLSAGLYGAALLVSAAVSAVCYFIFGTASVNMLAVAAMIAAFTLLGVVILWALHGALVRPAAVLSEFTGHMLDEEYGLADSDALAAAVPGLGAQVGELASRYKERLGFARSILHGLPIPCAIVDTDQRLTYLNRECLNMLGSREAPEAFYGRMISQIFYKDDRRSKIADCMAEDKRDMDVEAVFKHADGSDINVLINLFPLHDVEERVIGGCCLYMNTTQLKRHEREILNQNERIATAAGEATTISGKLAEASHQLERMVDQARQGSREQTDRTTETAAAMEEMNAAVLEVARFAQEAAGDARTANEQAREGEAVVGKVIEAIDEVSRHASGLKHSMEQLDHRAEEIGVVLGVIEDIADQTNLLALNAAIEAARAGEAGRGFAVVADEVRKLAEKTMHATSEVHSAVKGIQEVARENVRATQTAVESVNRSTELAGRSGEALASILSTTQDTADQVHSIAAAAEQQSSASEQISAATSEVTRVCGETDDLMVEASKAIDHLAELAEHLTAVVGNMK